MSPSTWRRIVGGPNRLAAGTERIWEWGLTPRRVTVIYLVFGLSALFVSDVLFVWLFSDPLLQQLQMVKGAVEVVLTGGLIYVLTRASRVSLERRTTELGRHREELRVLHRVLRHNLRNKLTVIKCRTEQLQGSVTSEHDRECCEAVLGAVEDMAHYIEKTRRIRQLTSEDDLTTVDLTTMIPSMLDSHEHVTDAVEVRTSLPERADVEVSRRFEAALGELVTNAVTHNNADRPTLSIAVDTGTGPAGVTTIEVTDNGPGLPEYAERVLREGERNQLVHLDGLGLWMVYLTVIESAGEFDIVESGPDGTTVRIRVPQTGVPGSRHSRSAPENFASRFGEDAMGRSTR